MIKIVDKIYAATAIDSLRKVLNVGGTGADLNYVYKAIMSAVKIALSLAGIVGFVMFLYASILYVTSMGDDAKAETAKKTILWTIIGIAVIALATFIVNYVDRSRGNS